MNKKEIEKIINDMIELLDPTTMNNEQKEKYNFAHFIASYIRDKVMELSESTTSDNYFIVETHDCEVNRYFVRHFENANAMFHKAAYAIAFSDCSDEVVIQIVANGDECHYTGWQPGMRYTFVSNSTGEVLYDAEFPEWDH